MAEAGKAPEDELEVDEEELDDEELDDEEDASAATSYLGGDDDEESDETSLEELLAQRAAARRPAEEEDDDIMSLASEKEPKLGGEPINPKVIPLKEQQEFVCQRCRLVKKRSQLADAERMLCRDCV
jgi:hypothetical protein